MQLTDKQKADLAAAGINWQQLLANLAAEAPQIIAIVLSILGVKQSAKTAKKAVVGCDHKCCCAEALAAILKAAEIEANHLSQCCCDDNSGS